MREALVAERACVVCGVHARRAELSLDAWRILRCARCGLRTLDPEPAEEHLVEVFDDGTIYEGAFEVRDDIMDRHALTLEALERRIEPGRLLDVGCGPGFFIEAARARGWDCVGVDPSPFSVEHIRSLGFEGHRGLLHQIDLPDASFDVVALLQVVEHLLDPRELLAGCMRLLRPGGVLLVATPNPAGVMARAQREGYAYWIPPVHCVWYTPSALRRLLRHAGFANVRATTWSACGRSQIDGLAALQASRFARVVPGSRHVKVGSMIGRVADRLHLGSIVEAMAVKS